MVRVSQDCKRYLWHIWHDDIFFESSKSRASFGRGLADEEGALEDELRHRAGVVAVGAVQQLPAANFVPEVGEDRLQGVQRQVNRPL